MQVNPKILKQKFEKSMPKYNENAIVQKEMAQILMDNLIKAFGVDYSNVLELGCGTGVLTSLILEKLNYKRLACNDIIKKSSQYLNDLGVECEFIDGNSSRIKPSFSSNLIVSNAMFQWYSSLEEPLEHFSRLLDKDGVLAFSTFSKNNFKEIKTALGISLNYLSVDDICNALEKNFNVISVYEYENVLEFTNPLEMLAHLKNTGVNSLNKEKMSFHDVKEFCEKISNADGVCSLTYNPLIIIAQKR